MVKKKCWAQNNFFRDWCAIVCIFFSKINNFNGYIEVVCEGALIVMIFNSEPAAVFKSWSRIPFYKLSVAIPLRDSITAMRDRM